MRRTDQPEQPRDPVTASLDASFDRLERKLLWGLGGLWSVLCFAIFAALRLN